MKKCFIISFEGLDGSGKTTQLYELYNYLSRYFVCEVLQYRMRVDKQFDLNKIDYDDVKLLLLLGCALVEEEITLFPRLSEKKIFLLDRALDTTIVYSRAFPSLLKCMSFYEKVLKAYEENTVIPDLTFFIDVKGSELAKRLRNKKDGRDYYDNRMIDESFRERVYKLYQSHCKNYSRIVRVDGNRSIEVIHRDIVNLLPMGELKAFCKEVV